MISIKRFFENIKYGSYPQNYDSSDLPIEYKQILITKGPIDCLNNNKEERLKVSLIERSLDNIIYKSTHKNANFDDLPFDGDEGSITRCSEKLHLQSYLKMLWSKMRYFGLLGNNYIFFIILLYLIRG